MKPKMVRSIFWCLLGIGGILGIIGALYSVVLAVAGMILMICNMLFYFLFYRCPHCGRYLDRNTGEYCPHCGEKIDE